MNLSATIIAIFSATCLYAQVNWSTRPHLKRTGDNLVKNPSITGTNHWFLDRSIYDSIVSRTPGSGSVKLIDPTPIRPDNAGDGVYTHFNDPIPVIPGKTYSFAVYMKVSGWPPPVVMIFGFFLDANKRFIENRIFTRQGFADTTTWHECVNIYTAKPGDAYIRLYVNLTENPDCINGSAAWVDDFYFGEGVGFEQPPSPKNAFEGSHVRVDELGNFEVFRDNQWEAFFPLAVYGDRNQDGSRYALYSQQGFNAEMRAETAEHVKKAKEAISDFNPDGMMAGIETSRFMAQGNLPLLCSNLEGIKNAGLMDNILFYYWDNEIFYGVWPDSIVEKIREFDADENGNKRNPIYSLNGMQSLARTYHNDQARLIDITGTYIPNERGTDDRGAVGNSHRFVILDNVHLQRCPAVFAQMNSGIGHNFRARLYNAISKGAKGMGFWVDCASGCLVDGIIVPPIEQQPWWKDFPNIRREIDQLLPLIRQPHWTTWRLSSSCESIQYGSRDYLGEGYIILANETELAQTTTFFVEALPYNADLVEDYFTGDSITVITGPAFTISLDPYSTAVYRLKKAKTTDVDSKMSQPKRFSLEQNYPNPFNPETAIKYSVAKPSHVQVKIYNQHGQLVFTLVDEEQPAGEYQIIWDGKNNQNQRVASGVYLYQMVTSQHVYTKKLLLLR